MRTRRVLGAWWLAVSCVLPYFVMSVSTGEFGPNTRQKMRTDAAVEADYKGSRWDRHSPGHEFSDSTEKPNHHALRTEWDSEAGRRKGFFDPRPEFRHFFAALQPHAKDV
jgi:hypothetical protein